MVVLTNLDMLYVTFKDLLLLKLHFNKYFNSYYGIEMDTYYLEHLVKHCLWYLIGLILILVRIPTHTIGFRRVYLEDTRCNLPLFLD